MRCEHRTLDDIRALGGNDPADDRCFATAARVSEINLALYRTFAQPFVRALANPPMAEWMQKLHPLRITYELFSDANPMMAMLKPMTAWAREHRSAAAADNPYLGWQENMSKQIVAAVDAWRDTRDRAVEKTFFAVYGSRALQSAVGVDPASTQPLRRPAKDLLHQELLHKRIAELRARMPVGGVREATIRALLYVGGARSAVDERGFEIVRRIRRESHESAVLPLPEFKTLVREEFYMLLIDEGAALAAIPKMLPDDAGARRQALDTLKRVLTAAGPIEGETQARLARIEQLFASGDEASGENVVPLAPTRPDVQSRAS
jgi:hypothetical protein